MTIAIEKLRNKVDGEYVGFGMDTDKVKPVHLANGLFRILLEKTNSTVLLHRFVFYQTSKGVVPNGHDIDTIVTDLIAANRLDRAIDKDQLDHFRRILKGLLSADNGVFDSGMESYSAGSEFFVSKDRIGQDAGEFIAQWLLKADSSLSKCLINALHDQSDVISALCKPLLKSEPRDCLPQIAFKALNCARKLQGNAATPMWRKIYQAAETLVSHLSGHPDKLFRMRMAVLFAGLVSFRHIMGLESYYDAEFGGCPIPILIDYGVGNDKNITAASRQCYQRASQSVARFYGWAFGEELRKEYTTAELRKIDFPNYKNQVKFIPESKQIWGLAKTRSKRVPDPYRIFGEAAFDILAMQAQADPCRYFRALGRNIGVLYPPKASIPWFALRQDVTELLLSCILKPGESIALPEVLARLWDTFGVAIGGLPSDEDALLHHRILEWDRDSLRRNVNDFKTHLRQMAFGIQLADGVIKVAVRA